MDSKAADQPPFWPQTTASMTPRRRSSAPFLTLPILIIILPIIALILLFIVVPPFLAITSQVFRPYNYTVKKSWDSLNILLVLFAIFCGILARRNDDGSNSGEYDTIANFNNVSNILDSTDKNSPPHSQQHWLDPPISTPATVTGRLRRSSSSYPDLRQDLWWETGDDRFRFFDDFDIHHKYHHSPAAVADINYGYQLRRTRSDFEEYSHVKVVPVDTFVLCSSPLSPPKSLPPLPPPPPPPAIRHKPRRKYQTVGRTERDADIKKVPPPPPPPPPPRPPPTPPQPVQTGSISEQKYIKIECIKSNATKEIKMVFASLYNQRKRIKKKHKTKNNVYQYDKFVHSTTEPTPEYSTLPPPSPTPPPPPPPPPHPPSVFHNLFKKNSKNKKVHHAPQPPPPPPPPPPPAPPRLSKRKSHAPPPAPRTPPRQPSRRINATNNGKPPLPTTTRANDRLYDENVNTNNQSPLIPKPPPPPPFKMPGFKLVVRGDFVSIHSSHSSRCGSPELGEVDDDDDDVNVFSSKESAAATEKVNMIVGGDRDGVGSVFCPSPDVNTKADSFIARLRDEWRLEKMNSIREKQNMSTGKDPLQT